LNLVLFEPEEIAAPLVRVDPRAKHVLDVLRRKVGDAFDAGVVNGPRGKAVVTAITATALTFSFSPTSPVALPFPITLVVGLPRPQTARDILRDAITLGVWAIHFVRTEKGESSYGQSTLWSSGEWRRHVLAGAEQAFDTRVPEIVCGKTLAETLAIVASVPTPTDHASDSRELTIPRVRIALDNYEAAEPLSAHPIDRHTHVVLAIGAERGWSNGERDALREAGFTLAHLGRRVFRTETAVVASLSIVRAKLGLI
jgi:16S rRNA (uracil1498-N3)-methyltransferase